MSGPVLVSACLLGFPCRPDCNDKRDEAVLSKLAGREVVPVCPEVAGGLGVPRLRSWQDGGRVVDERGADVTEAFERGAEAAAGAARRFGVGLAVLKQNSPSCGTHTVGTAAGRAPGIGRAAARLAAAGVRIRGEDQPW